MTSGGTESILTAVKVRLQRVCASVRFRGCTRGGIALCRHGAHATASQKPSRITPPCPLLQASRDYMAATRGIAEPEMVIAVSAHAAFVKAAGG